jgi:hypothetical protein
MNGRVLVSAAIVAACGTTVAACVLADPPPTLPVVPEGRPAIITDSVTPPVGVITSWPTAFFVPVTVLDPTQSLQWYAFEDFTSQSQWGTPSGYGPTYPADGSTLFTVTARNVQVPVGPGCHRVAIVVAYAFGQGYVPEAPGGDLAEWLYAPSGDRGDCAGYDAGKLADGAFPDGSLPDSTVLEGGT